MVSSMWIDAKDVQQILGCGQTSSYVIIKDLKNEMKSKGFYVSPNAKIPIQYFCDRFGIDVEVVRQELTKEKQPA